jgi:hypothetical protein
MNTYLLTLEFYDDLSTNDLGWIREFVSQQKFSNLKEFWHGHFVEFEFETTLDLWDLEESIDTSTKQHFGEWMDAKFEGSHLLNMTLIS